MTLLFSVEAALIGDEPSVDMAGTVGSIGSMTGVIGAWNEIFKDDPIVSATNRACKYQVFHELAKLRRQKDTLPWSLPKPWPSMVSQLSKTEEDLLRS